MAKIYGTPIMAGGSGGMNKDLPPLLDNFKARIVVDDEAGTLPSNDTNIELSANKMEESRANELAGAVWVYGDHEPENVNDGTKIQLSREGVVVLSLNSLPSGSKVKLGTYDGETLKWIVARDSVTQDLRLVLDKDSVTAIGTMQYDAEEPSNPDAKRKTKGNNKYSISNINQWLNSDGAANEWYTAQHEYDAPPDYQNKAGFLNQWSEIDKSILQKTNWTSTLSSVDGSGMDVFSQKVVLMSTTELGLEENTGGNKLDIFNSNGDRATGSYYFTRTPYPSSSYNVCQVTQSGTINYYYIVNEANGIRPICAPNPSTTVSGPDNEGYYTIGGEATVQKTIQWNNEANFFARQFTYNSKKQYQTMLEGAIAKINLISQSIAELPSGSKVKLGTWNDTPLQWKVARDTSDQSIRLVLEPTSVSLLGNKMYDNKEPSNSDANRRDYGNNRYIYSNIHQWLNATEATSWYTAQHSADAAPDYSSQAGFLSGWSENHINALDRATLTTSRANIDGGGTETFVARVALISTTELGLQNSTGGGRLDIFNSAGDRATGSNYWTRTHYPSYSSGAYRLTGPGGLSYDYNVSNASGVRPLCSPKSTTYVSLQPDDDGCYTITRVNE